MFWREKGEDRIRGLNREGNGSEGKVGDAGRDNYNWNKRHFEEPYGKPNTLDYQSIKICERNQNWITK